MSITAKKYTYITIIALLTMTLLIVLLPHSVSAKKIYKVGASDLQVREKPSPDGKVLGKLGPDHKVVAFDEKHGWVQTYYDGETAWVASQFLYEAEDADSSSSAPTQKVSEEQTLQVKKRIEVKASGVRLRKGPSTHDNIIGNLENNESLTLKNTENGWHHVTTASGETGWVASWLTDSPTSSETDSNSGQVTTENTNATTPNTPKKQTNGSLNGINVFLDPGHGGSDPGSFGINNEQEKDLTLRTAETIAQSLRNAGANVSFTRSGDEYVSLSNRVAQSTQGHTDVFLSLHYNAYPIQSVNGFSTHYYSNNGEDRQLALTLQETMSQELPLHNRGVMQDDYHVLRENSNLAVLLELGFITNFGDLAAIQTEDYQNKVASSVTNGLKAYYQ